MVYAPRIAAVALLVGLCFALTTVAAAYASRRADLRMLDTDTASRLHADYSRDPTNIKLRRLDPEIIDDATRDEVALLTTATPRRVTIAREATATPTPNDTPRVTATVSSTPRATSTPPGSATPSGTSTAFRTATPPPPTASPVLPTLAPETVVPPDTATPLPKPTDTPVIKPTSTPAPPTATPTPHAPPVAPSLTPTHTKTASPTLSPSPTATRTNTPSPTVTPSPTNTATLTATSTPTPTNTSTSTPTPTSTSTPTPSFTPTPTPTPSFTPTPTPTASNTPAPTPTHTATPTPTVTPTPTATVTPTVIQLEASADTYVEMDEVADINGSANDFIVDGDSDKVNRALIRFDVTGIPSGATIVDATLTLCYSGNPSGGAQTRVHSLHRVTSDWLELVVTWALQPAFAPAVSASILVPSSEQCVTFDVASDVQAWVDGTSNFGWLLKDANEGQPGSSDAKYRSREDGSPTDHPHLDITYQP